ncbi:hypothetical protein GQ457_15G014720 [Hibiscus cannabinus]
MQGPQLQRHIDATLGCGNLREAVTLPLVKISTKISYNLELIFSPILSCMCGFLQSSEYLVLYTNRVLHCKPLSNYVSRTKGYCKKPIEVSTPKYVESMMDWIETQLGHVIEETL